MLEICMKLAEEQLLVLAEQVANVSMPGYAVLPAVTEWVMEQGWTRSYTRIDSVGLVKYWLYFALYMTSVEFFVYWMHRGLHEIRLGYR